MAVTVQQVFDMAIHAIDEQNETSGASCILPFSTSPC